MAVALIWTFVSVHFMGVTLTSTLFEQCLWSLSAPERTIWLCRDGKSHLCLYLFGGVVRVVCSGAYQSFLVKMDTRC